MIRDLANSNFLKKHLFYWSFSNMFIKTSKLRIDLKIFLFFSFLFFVIIANQLHESYPDEFENILGGKFILQGRFPYIGFFTHHNPFAYFFSSFLLIFSGTSFVKFRILLGIFYFCYSLVLYFCFRALFKGSNLPVLVLLSFISFIFVGATYFWGHMLLADNLSAYLLIIPYMILILKGVERKKISLKWLFILSLFLSLAFFTSSSLLFFILVGYLYIFYIIVSGRKFYGLISLKKLVLLVIYFSLPYVLFLSYLFLTGSYREFYLQAIRYNTDVYVQFPDGASFRNPIRLAIAYMYKFFSEFGPALVMVKDLNFSNPVFHTFALGNITLVFYLAFNGHFPLLLFVVFSMVFSSLRGGGPLSSGEMDYQSVQYYFVSLTNSLTAFFYIASDLQNKIRIDYLRKIVYSFLFILLGLYLFFLFLLFSEKFSEKTYLKYMGKQSLIYDRPSVAFVVNRILDKDDYYFIGPFDFENQLYLNSRPASKYIVVLTGMDFVPRIQREILQDLSETKPKIIVFDTGFTFFNGSVPSGRFLSDFFANDYTTLNKLDLYDGMYKYNYRQFGRYIFPDHFFIRKDFLDDALPVFIELGLVEKQ